MVEFCKILEPFSDTKFYGDDWSSYLKYLNIEIHKMKKKDAQAIEYKNLTLRT